MIGYLSETGFLKHPLPFFNRRDPKDNGSMPERHSSLICTHGVGKEPEGVL